VQTFAYNRWSTAVARTPINPSGRQEGDKCWGSGANYWPAAAPSIAAVKLIDESTSPSFAWEVHSAVEIGMAANLSQL
jgi:hypothetical protein